MNNFFPKVKFAFPLMHKNIQIAFTNGMPRDVYVTRCGIQAAVLLKPLYLSGLPKQDATDGEANAQQKLLPHKFLKIKIIL